ncbi:MAG TPA: hypothetical protein DIW23_10410 [Anaerolineae bacterium]|nr:hypothetical protein [Anaerolineae bacterium]HRJ76116.1 hypothetical protein [Anaerolineales bacterium]
MSKNSTLLPHDEIIDNLKEVQLLLKHSIAVQLYIAGASQNEIVKNLHLSKTTVNKMVKGIKKDLKREEKK